MTPMKMRAIYIKPNKRRRFIFAFLRLRKSNRCNLIATKTETPALADE